MSIERYILISVDAWGEFLKNHFAVQSTIMYVFCMHTYRLMTSLYIKKAEPAYIIECLHAYIIESRVVTQAYVYIQSTTSNL